MGTVRTEAPQAQRIVDPATHARTTTSAATAGSVALAAATFVIGDAAIAAVVAAIRHLTDGALLQWTTAGAVVAAATFVLLGIPQIRLGRSQTSQASRPTRATESHDDDRRTRLASRLMASVEQQPAPIRASAFVAVSAVAGPLAVGLVTGRRHHPRAFELTAAAAVVFGATWSAVYLGVLSTLL